MTTYMIDSITVTREKVYKGAGWLVVSDPALLTSFPGVLESVMQPSAPADAGETAYVVLSGEVDILLNMGTPKERRIARLGKDQPIGEIALLATVPRTAAARAFSEVTALQIDKEAFLQIVQNDPKVASNLARIASERLASTLEQMQEAA